MRRLKLTNVVVAALTLGLATVACGARSQQRATSHGIPAAFQRTCVTPPLVPGKLPAHWKQRSTAVGRIYLYLVAEYSHSPPSDFDALPGTRGRRYRGAKLVILARGPGAVTLSIARGDRTVASLAYNNASWDRGYPLSDGTSSVTFNDCKIPVSQWAGTFIVAGARCLTLTASDISGTVVGRRRVAFGRRRC